MSDQPQMSHDPLAHLIHAAGRRESPPTQAYERALAAATQVWQTKVQQRRRRMVIALAAGMAALAIGATIALRSVHIEQRAAEPIAQVARLIGAARVRPVDARSWASLQETGQIGAGTTLRTEPASAVALQLDEVSIRIAGDAEVVLESRSRLRLVRGKVYVDTSSTAIAGRMTIASDAGSVSDVGTQFEVEYREQSYHVRVREGAILLQRATEQRRGSAGEQISIDPSGRVRIGSIASDDPQWRWTQSLATAPDIDNQPLTTLLAWVARETGVPIRYATPAVERRATTTILHGSIRHLEPLEALNVMLATTDLRHEVLIDGTIMIK